MTSLQPTAPNRLIDPVVLARIGDLELVARVVVEGIINGLHRSPHLGSSMDFAEHRAYMPGDDIRRIDWKLFARSDRHFIKEFEADTNTNFTVLLDTSLSMHYGASVEGGVQRSLSKLDYARYLAACLTYLASTQRDRVGLVTFDSQIREYVPPSAKHLNVVLHTLDRLGDAPPPIPETRPSAAPNGARVMPPDLKSVTRRIGESFRRRSIVLLISDLYEEPRAVLDALAYLRGKGNDVVVFHILDRRELEFPFTDSANFVDLETGERMPIIPDYLRTQYRALVAEHIASLGRVLGENRVDYALFDTSKPLDHALFRFLSSRERMRQARLTARG
ncbi:MAG TPA: DUF58 domain-containing protein [Gemmatimonadaceae bacterium]|nr:DUF58 domain-containing protein [Gemmatimonadaceae bacterium]